MQPLIDVEFVNAARQLVPQFGKFVAFRVGRQRKDSQIFVKRKPESVEWPESDVLISRELYAARCCLPIHKAVGPSLRDGLLNGGHVTADYFSI